MLLIFNYEFYIQKGRRMKVLSIKEPYATLIKEKEKFVETRSFKTSYRGELYIHASKETLKSKNKDFQKLISNLSLNNGYIICKCRLKDCIYMTDEYIENLKRENYQEYICGNYKEGRYAWILEDIEPLEHPIEVIGRLNIWNFYQEDEIMNLMNDIEYGWVDKFGNKKDIVDETYSDNYILQSPKELMISKIGVCWDQVELERYYFKGYDIKTYFIAYYDDNKCPTHTFLTYKKEDKYYWFEHSWKKYKGIHEYTSIDLLLSDIKEKFINDIKEDYNNKLDMDYLCLYEYKKPNYHISTEEFYKHCEGGFKIKK